MFLFVKKNLKENLKIFLFILLILFIYNFINEKPSFIKFYRWPNFGDNYLFGILLVSIFLIDIKNIKFFKSDIFFVSFLVYCIMLEFFYFKVANITLIRDLFSIFLTFKVLQLINLEQKNKKILSYLIVIFFFLSITYFLIFFSWVYLNLEIDFINYYGISLKNFFFFKIFCLIIICAKYNKVNLSIFFYLIALTILIFFTSRAGVITFIFSTIFIIFAIKKIRASQKFFLITMHIILVLFFLSPKFFKEVKQSFYSKDQYSRVLNYNSNQLELNFSKQNSTIHRVFHMKKNFNNLSKNYLMGSGYESIIQREHKLIAKTCECSLFHPIFAYGSIGLLFLTILFYLIYLDYKSSFHNQNNLVFVISFIIVFIFYTSSLPLYPAWFGLILYFLLNSNSKSKILENKKYVEKY